MRTERLVELFSEKLPSSQLTEDQLNNDIVRLKENDFSVGLIFFSINYCHKYYPSEIEVSLYLTLLEHEEELRKYYSIAKAKRDRRALKESEEKYDSKNEYKGANTPSWFRKSFDLNMFE